MTKDLVTALDDHSVQWRHEDRHRTVLWAARRRRRSRGRSSAADRAGRALHTLTSRCPGSGGFRGSAIRRVDNVPGAAGAIQEAPALPATSNAPSADSRCGHSPPFCRGSLAIIGRARGVAGSRPPHMSGLRRGFSWLAIHVFS
jgi:hypothetical protein